MRCTEELPQAFLDYLHYFHVERDYFECHEVLEEYWKEADNHPIWVSLIQLAVSLYHQRRGNQVGAIKMMQSAIAIAQKHITELKDLGLDTERLLMLMNERLDHIQQGIAYKSIELPLTSSLLKHCQEKAIQSGLVWAIQSDLENKQLIHKHTLRDRSAVINERVQSLQKKKKERR